MSSSYSILGGMPFTSHTSLLKDSQMLDLDFALKQVVPIHGILTPLPMVF
jgi:hypothetical protein